MFVFDNFESVYEILVIIANACKSFFKNAS